MRGSVATPSSREPHRVIRIQHGEGREPQRTTEEIEIALRAKRLAYLREDPWFSAFAVLNPLLRPTAPNVHSVIRITLRRRLRHRLCLDLHHEPRIRQPCDEQQRRAWRMPAINRIARRA